VLVILQLGSKGIWQVHLIKRSLQGEIPCTNHLDECMGHQATFNCTAEAKVMLVLFSLLLHLTHHAFFEDYSACRILPPDVISH
jgi:hypothetical protein